MRWLRKIWERISLSHARQEIQYLEALNAKLDQLLSNVPDPNTLAGKSYWAIIHSLSNVRDIEEVRLVCDPPQLWKLDHQVGNACRCNSESEGGKWYWQGTATQFGICFSKLEA